MSLALRFANYAVLLAFGVGVLWLAVVKPSSTITGGLNLPPFGLAILAMRQDARRAVHWLSLGWNALWAALYGGMAVMAIWGNVGMLGVTITAVIFAVCAANARFNWNQLRHSQRAQ